MTDPAGSSSRIGGSRASQQQFNVVRRLYKQSSLNVDAGYQTPALTLRQNCTKLLRKCGYGGDCFKNTIPILRWLPKYSIKDNLIGDFVAGATTAVLHIPQGMAYSFLAYCPPTVGLYMGFFPIIIYVILGSSQHVCLGTFAVTLLMAGKVVLDHAAILGNSESSYTPVEVLSALTLTVGLMQIAMWCLRIGAVSSILSEPLVSGLTTGASLQVASSQFKELFGIKLPKLPTNFKILFNVIEICKHLQQTNWIAVIVSAISCFLLIVNNEVMKLWLSQRTKIPFPAELLVVVVGALVSRCMDLKGNYNVILVGSLPTGLPIPKIPPLELLHKILLDALSITMVTYTVTLSMGLILATTHEIDANQELLALGASNIFGCFFGCGPMCASLSRSYVQYTVGGRTLLTSLFSATWILLVLLWIGPFFETLPRSVLAAIVLIALKGLYLQIYDLPKFWKLSKLDGIVWIVTFLVTVIIHVDYGLIAGLLTSVATLFFRSQTPYICLLGRVMDTELYLDIKRYTAAEEIPGIKIFHYCGGLNFASKNLFKSKLYRKIGYLRAEKEQANEMNAAAASYSRDPHFSKKVHCVIIDAAALSYLDAPGIKALVEAHKDFTSVGITMLLAGANGPVLEMIEKFNSLEKKNQLKLLTFPTVHDAVTYYNFLAKQQQSLVQPSQEQV